MTTPSKTTHNGGGPSDHHLGGSHLSSPHGRLSKRFHALKLKHTKPDSSSAVGSTTSIKSATDSASSPQSADLEREEFPGGDAMLEVLTRLQSYQESMQMQLEVREGCGIVEKGVACSNKLCICKLTYASCEESGH